MIFQMIYRIIMFYSIIIKNEKNTGKHATLGNSWYDGIVFISILRNHIMWSIVFKQN